MPKELLEAKKLELIQEKVGYCLQRELAPANVCSLRPKKQPMKHVDGVRMVSAGTEKYRKYETGSVATVVGVPREVIAGVVGEVGAGNSIEEAETLTEALEIPVAEVEVLADVDREHPVRQVLDADIREKTAMVDLRHPLIAMCQVIKVDAEETEVETDRRSTQSHRFKPPLDRFPAHLHQDAEHVPSLVHQVRSGDLGVDQLHQNEAIEEEVEEAEEGVPDVIPVVVPTLHLKALARLPLDLGDLEEPRPNL